MSGWSPPSPSPAVAVTLAFGWLLVLAYSLLLLQNSLAGVLPGLLIAAGYYAWRLLAAVEAAADGLQRLADEQERSADTVAREPTRER
jgi:hypothetical protein